MFVRRKGADPQCVAITSLAGIAAENRAMGRDWWPTTADLLTRIRRPDIAHAYDALATISDDLDTEMQRAWRGTCELVEANWPAIEWIAWLLCQCGRLSGDDLAQLLTV